MGWLWLQADWFYARKIAFIEFHNAYSTCSGSGKFYLSYSFPYPVSNFKVVPASRGQGGWRNWGILCPFPSNARKRSVSSNTVYSQCSACLGGRIFGNQWLKNTCFALTDEISPLPPSLHEAFYCLTKLNHKYKCCMLVSWEKMWFFTINIF